MSSTQDVKYSPEKVEQGQALANKLFNASRFVLGRVREDAEPAPRPVTVEDRWILSRLQRVTGETRARIESYDFSKAALGLYDFVYNELCDWYLELTKGREFDADLSSTILHVLRETLALAHPLIPFVTEEVWGHVPGAQGLLAQARYPIVDGAVVDPEAERQIGAVIASVRAVRSWREEAGVRAGARLVVRVAAEGYGQTLPLVARLARLEGNGAGDAEAIASVPVPGGALEVLPSPDVDPREAARRVEAERARLRAEIARAEGKLANEGFVSKAPVHLVEAERSKLERLRGKLEAL
jgi:valyl-tRNA synthetase